MSPDLLLEETISGGMRKGIVEALLEVLERTDNFTLTHSYRVAQLAVPIGAAMRLSEDAIEPCVWRPFCTTSARPSSRPRSC